MSRNTLKSPRVIKRYPNRKLYDTETSSYVTIDFVANLIRDGVSIKVVESKSNKDITNTTLASIILEAEKKTTRTGSLRVLESIIKRGSILDFLLNDGVKKELKAPELDFSELDKKVSKVFSKKLTKEELAKLMKIFKNYADFIIMKIKSELEQKRKLDARKMNSLKKELLTLKEELKTLRSVRYDDYDE